MEIIQIGSFQVKAGGKLKSTLSIINNMSIQSIAQADDQEDFNSILLIQKIEQFERYNKFSLTDLENDISLVLLDKQQNIDRFKPNQIILVHQAKVVQYDQNKILLIQKANQFILLANSLNTKKCFNEECDRYISNKQIYCSPHFYEYMKYNDLINRVDLDQCSLQVLQQKQRINFSENITVNIDEYINQKKQLQYNKQQQTNGNYRQIKPSHQILSENHPERVQKVKKIKTITYKIQDEQNEPYDFKSILLEQITGKKVEKDLKVDQNKKVSAPKSQYVSFQPVKAYYCEVCKKYTQNLNLMCQSSGHQIVQKQIKELHLICRYCHQITITLSNKYSQMSCSKCGKQGFQYDE